MKCYATIKSFSEYSNTNSRIGSHWILQEHSGIVLQTVLVLVQHHGSGYLQNMETPCTFTVRSYISGNKIMIPVWH